MYREPAVQAVRVAKAAPKRKPAKAVKVAKTPAKRKAVRAAKVAPKRTRLGSALERAAQQDPDQVREYLKAFSGSLKKGAVVASGRASPAPAKKETSPMAKKRAAKSAKKTATKKPAARKRTRKAPAAKPAAATTAAKPKSRKRTVRAKVVSAARALAPKKVRSVKRANLKRGKYMDSKGTWRKVNPTNDTKLLIAKVASFGVGLAVAETLDRYIATRASDKAKELYGEAAVKAIRSRPDGVRMFAQAAGAGVLGVGAYMLRKKSAYATSILGGMAAAFGVKLFTQIVVDVAIPTLLKTKTADEASYGNRLFPDKMAFFDESIKRQLIQPGMMNGAPRFFVGNPTRSQGSVGTVRVPLSLDEAMPGSVGADHKVSSSYNLTEPSLSVNFNHWDAIALGEGESNAARLKRIEHSYNLSQVARGISLGARYIDFTKAYATPEEFVRSFTKGPFVNYWHESNKAVRHALEHAAVKAFILNPPRAKFGVAGTEADGSVGCSSCGQPKTSCGCTRTPVGTDYAVPGVSPLPFGGGATNDGTEGGTDGGDSSREPRIPTPQANTPLETPRTVFTPNPRVSPVPVTKNFLDLSRYRGGVRRTGPSIR